MYWKVQVANADGSKDAILTIHANNDEQARHIARRDFPGDDWLITAYGPAETFVPLPLAVELVEELI